MERHEDPGLAETSRRPRPRGAAVRSESGPPIGGRHGAVSGWLAAMPLLVTAAVYAPWLARGFTSEDFLLIRILHDHPPWEDFSGLLFGPWLGVTVLDFYRPFAWLVFGVEEAVFGTWSPGYNLVHLTIHLWSVSRVWVLADRLLPAEPHARGTPADRLPSLAAALTFGLYPLSPNSVSWPASYANVLGVALVLTGLCLYVDARRRRSRGRGVLAALSTLLALGSYEAGVLLPAGIVLLELLVLRSTLRWKLGIAALSTAVLAAYLGFRRLVLGAAVGGYEGFHDLLLGPVRDLVSRIGRVLALLAWPRFERPMPSEAAGWAALAVLGAAFAFEAFTFGASARRRDAGARDGLRLALFAASFVLAALFPFGYRLASPAEGRFFYPAVAGLGLFLAAVVRTLTRRLTGPRAVLAIVPLALLPVLYAPRLVLHLQLLDRAARESTALDAALARRAREIDQPIFVGGYPRFVTSETGLNLAQVHSYGLWDRGRRPFTQEVRDVYPLLTASRPAASALADVGTVFDWREGRLERVEPGTEAPSLRIVGIDDRPAGPFLRFEAPRDLLPHRFELVVATAASTIRSPFRPGPAAQNGTTPGDLQATAPRPDDYLDLIEPLYPDEDLFVWIEVIGSSREPLAFSKAVRLGFDPTGPGRRRLALRPQADEGASSRSTSRAQ